MFSSLSKQTKEQLCQELSRIDSNRSVSDKTNVSTCKVGIVTYITPAGVGELPVKIHDGEWGHGDGALVKFTNGEVAILFDQQNYTTVDDDTFYAVLAHEIGHFLCNHLNMVGFDIPNKFEKENRQAIKKGDQEKHTYYGTMAIVDGGYFTREFEADVVACRFVGLKELTYTHANSSLDHPNILAKIEKINRLAALKEKFGVGYIGDQHYQLVYKQDNLPKTKIENKP